MATLVTRRSYLVISLCPFRNVFCSQLVISCRAEKTLFSIHVILVLAGERAVLDLASFKFFLPFIYTGGERERMTANHETYLLMASTQNDMEDWVKTIRRVIWAPFGGG